MLDLRVLRLVSALNVVSFQTWQPVVKVQLHSAGDASPLTALLLPHIFPICSVVAPCQRGASPPSVRRWTFTTGCSVRRCWQPVVKVWLHSTGDASSRAALLLPQILPVLHPTVHNTHGGGPALRSSRRSAGAPTARTVRRGVEAGASPPSVRRWTLTTGCWRSSPLCCSARRRRPGHKSRSHR